MKAETFPVPCYLSWLTVFGKGGKTTEKFPGMLHNKSLKKSKTKRSEKLLKLILFKNKKKLRKTETLFRINLFYLPNRTPKSGTTFSREGWVYYYNLSTTVGRHSTIGGRSMLPNHMWKYNFFENCMNLAYICVFRKLELVK